MKTATRLRPATASRPSRAWFATLLATPVLVLALTGCTPGAQDAADSNPGGGGSSTGQPGTDAEFSVARDAYDRTLAQCFRDQGLDVADPLPGKGIVETSPEIREAYPACVTKIGDPPSSAGVALAPDDVEKLLDRAKCLRDMGYEIQEPTANDAGFIPAEVTAEDFEKCEAEAGM